MTVRRPTLATVVWAAIVLFFVLVGVDVYRSVGRFDTIVYRVSLRNSRYSRVPVGMTENEVISILGRPDGRVPNPRYEGWYYGLKPGYRLKTYKAFVEFDPYGRVTIAIADDPTSWPRGRPTSGMTKQQVLRMLGKPDEVDLSLSNYVLCWNYRLWNKSTFRVVFDRRGRVSCP